MELIKKTFMSFFGPLTFYILNILRTKAVLKAPRLHISFLCLFSKALGALLSPSSKVAMLTLLRKYIKEIQRKLLHPHK